MNIFIKFETDSISFQLRQYGTGRMRALPSEVIDRHGDYQEVRAGSIRETAKNGYQEGLLQQGIVIGSLPMIDYLAERFP